MDSAWVVWWSIGGNEWRLTGLLGGQDGPGDPSWARGPGPLTGDYQPFGTAAGVTTISEVA